MNATYVLPEKFQKLKIWINAAASISSSKYYKRNNAYFAYRHFSIFFN